MIFFVNGFGHFSVMAHHSKAVSWIPVLGHLVRSTPYRGSTKSSSLTKSAIARDPLTHQFLPPFTALDSTVEA
jgi:hypothetical protein